MVDVFRAPQYCPKHAREVLAVPWRLKVFRMQSGIASPETRKPLMVEHALLSKNAADNKHTVG
ncbi:hypothetical protein [uncultured Desulfovibrio sp.]|uniref:hypothetical protein n=1 Tax=uncultured Desulfovibrio sp. TaxID=167968 RepID=UPI00345C2070